VEFDPTNGIVGNRDLIRVGVARTPRQAVPLSGSYDGKKGDFDSMTVQVNVISEALHPAVAQPANVNAHPEGLKPETLDTPEPAQPSASHAFSRPA
jgi:hypothetical protein